MGWQAPGYDQSDQHPVVCVNWLDAQAYTLWLSQRTGLAYRLLSETEWEYAARAGTTTARWWGDLPQDACEYANAMDRSTVTALQLARTAQAVHLCTDGYVYTAPVGQFRPNGFGLYDMLGNAWEWVADCTTPNYAGRPTDERALGEASCMRRVARGGGWAYSSWTVRAGYRIWSPSTERFNDFGFRVARSLD